MADGSFVRSVATMALFKGVGGLSRVLSPVVLIWLMGAADLGNLVVAVAAGTLVFGLVNLGLPQSAVHFVASQRMSSQRVLWLASLIAAGVAAVGSGLGLLLVAMGRADWPLVVSVGCLPAVMVLHRVSSAVLLGAGEVIRAGVSSTAGEIVPVVFALGAAIVGSDWSVVLLAWTLGLTSTMAWSVSEAAALHRPGREAAFLTIARHSRSIHLSSLSTLASYRIDVLLLSFLAGSADAGRYAVIVAVAEGLWLLSIAVSDIVSVATARSPEETVQLVEVLSRLLLTTNVLLAGLGWLLLGLMGDRVGIESDRAAVVFVLFGVAALSASRVLATYMSASGRPERNVPGSIGALAINVVANLVLIPRIGIAGAALATLLSYSVTLLVRADNHAALTGTSRRFLIPRVSDVRIVLDRVGVAGSR